MSGAAAPYHHGDVHRAAVEAVVAAIRRGGEREVTIRSIAGEIGVSHAALYRHVGSVDELVDEATARFLDALVGDAPADEPVEAFLARYVEHAVGDPHHYRSAFARARDADRAPSTAASLRRLRDHAGRVFGHAWPDDSRGATIHRVIRTWSTVHGMLDLAALGLVVTDGPDALVRYVVRSALRSAHA